MVRSNLRLDWPFADWNFGDWSEKVFNLAIHLEFFHSLIWPFVGPESNLVGPKSAGHSLHELGRGKSSISAKKLILPCTENVCKWLIDAALQYVGRERKVIWSDRNSEISFIKLNK